MLRLVVVVYRPCRRSTDSLSPTPSTSAHPSSARRATAADDQTQCEYLLPTPCILQGSKLIYQWSVMPSRRDFLYISNRLPPSAKMKDLLSSPSPHKQPLRLGRGEPTRFLQLLNHVGLLCEHGVVLLNIMSLFFPLHLTQMFQWVLYAQMCLILGDCRVFIREYEPLRAYWR